MLQRHCVRGKLRIDRQLPAMGRITPAAAVNDSDNAAGKDLPPRFPTVAFDHADHSLARTLPGFSAKRLNWFESSADS
jgi:hypothetical protein